MANNHQPMSNDELRAAAPSIFATKPWERMSSKYTFIPTSQIVDKMRTEGFVPVTATQSRTRIEGKSNFTKHMIRFRQAGAQPVARELGALHMELVLTNSHDGASAYILNGGVFRLACLNGMVVCDSEIAAIKVRHSGSADAIIDASFTVAEQFPKVLDSVHEFSAKQLTEKQREIFATSALISRYGDMEAAPVTPQQLLVPARMDDAKPSLWNTMNTVQEKTINGGVGYRNRETSRKGRTRGVSGISESVRLNQALWYLTTEMNKLVSA